MPLLTNINAASGRVPDMNRLRAEFRMMSNHLHGPYFNNYCGEHESEHPGIAQLSGASHADGGLCFLYCFYSAYNLLSKGRPSLSTLENAHARRRAYMNEESRLVRSMIPAPIPTSFAYTRIRRPRTQDAGPLVVRPTHESLGLPSCGEQAILDQLLANEGVSTFDLTGLFEKCGVCDRYFIASLLRVHIQSCCSDM